MQGILHQLRANAFPGHLLHPLPVHGLIDVLDDPLRDLGLLPLRIQMGYGGDGPPDTLVQFVVDAVQHLLRVLTLALDGNLLGGVQQALRRRHCWRMRPWLCQRLRRRQCWRLRLWQHGRWLRRRKRRRLRWRQCRWLRWWQSRWLRCRQCRRLQRHHWWQLLHRYQRPTLRRLAAALRAGATVRVWRWRWRHHRQGRAVWWGQRGSRAAGGVHRPTGSHHTE
mmetsp:Transcript_12546/g.34606  ORF Transcript_12546/g.34606 Transcript_12546/m.34606 type:complete len:223 (-) Transcript_12546:48-716(-)